MCTKVDSQCLEYLGYITLAKQLKNKSREDELEQKLGMLPQKVFEPIVPLHHSVPQRHWKNEMSSLAL